MRMHNLTRINPPNISLSIKVNMTDNSSMQGMITITLIINNMNKLTKEDNIIIEKRRAHILHSTKPVICFKPVSVHFLNISFISLFFLNQNDDAREKKNESAAADGVEMFR